MPLIAATLVFFVVVIACVLPLLMGGEGKGKQVVRRLDAIEGKHRQGRGLIDVGLMRNELLSAVPFLNLLLARWPGAMRLGRLLEQAGMKLKPGKLVLIIGVCGLASYLILEQLYGSMLLALLAGLAAGSIPLAVVYFMRHRRLRAFEEHFPEAIDLLSRALRAGHAFSTGMEMIGRELPEPVAGEFRTTFEEQKLGLPLREALLSLTDRMPLVDVRFFVTALLIQKETGGNLAEILDTLATTIRERCKILGELRIRTAQGRLTASILISLPPVMLIVLKSLNPDYVKLLWQDPWGIYMLAASAVLQVIGSVILWKVVHIEV